LLGLSTSLPNEIGPRNSHFHPDLFHEIGAGQFSGCFLRLTLPYSSEELIDWILLSDPRTDGIESFL
jgi:hypothetical protein